MKSDIYVRKGVPEDAEACIELRGRTRQNAVSRARLRELGITAESWADHIRHEQVVGYVGTSSAMLAGYCFGHTQTGEIEVLAILPEYEAQGLGRRLLELTCDALFALGHRRLFLGTSEDPASRSYGFYRYLGWQPTGTFDAHGDEVLERFAPGASS